MRVRIPLPAAWEGWQLLEELGAGTAGTVWLAEDPSGRQTAVKILPGEGRLPSEKLLSALRDCPGVVPIRAAVSENGYSYLAMDHLASFAQLLRERELTEAEQIDAVIDICRTLCALEERGILHRDIKPENILLDAQGHCVLGDIDQLRMPSPEGSALSIQGTLSYMAPEVYRGRRYDCRADLYSLGMVIYRCSNRGRLPFTDPEKRILTERDMEHALAKRMQGAPLPPPCDASEAFAAILQKLCQPAPEDRYPNASALLRDLTRLQAGQLRQPFLKTIPRRKIRIAAALGSLLLAVLLAAEGYGLWLHSPQIPETVWQEGSGVTYTMDHAGTLVFSGTGTVEDINTEDWAELCRTARKLVIRGTIDSFQVSFSNAERLEVLIVEDGVRFLNQNCQFTDCKKLRSVSLADSVQELGKSEFSNCTALTAIRLPRSLQSVPAECFSNCENLTSVELPASVTQIGACAFLRTPWLASKQDADGFTIINGTLLAIPAEVTELVIPADRGITVLSSDLSNLNNGVETLTVPEGVTAIDAQAFQCSPKLHKVTLPESLVSIGYNAFSSCTSLTEVTLSPQTTDFGENPFANTPFLAAHTSEDGFSVVNGVLLAYSGSEIDLVIPDDLGIHTIGPSVFRLDRRLRSVVIPEGVETIRESAFLLCTALEEIFLPDSLKIVERGAFSGTPWQQR